MALYVTQIYLVSLCLHCISLGFYRHCHPSFCFMIIFHCLSSFCFKHKMVLYKGESGLNKSSIIIIKCSLNVLNVASSIAFFCQFVLEGGEAWGMVGNN